MYKISANTLFMGQKLVFVPECHSTNTLAAELSQKTSIAEGTIVITHHQTAGRGQRGNTWEAEQGKNLTFSVVLRPTFLEAADQFELNKVVALALTDALHVLEIADVRIKWPNDIMIGTRKVCGVLIENSLSQTKINQSIVGIGLNVNQSAFNIAMPTSLSLATGKLFDLNSVLNAIIVALEARYLQLRSGKQQQLHRDYHNLLYWRNEEHTFKSEEGIFQGYVLGVNTMGKLEVEVKNIIRSFNLKEIQFIE